MNEFVLKKNYKGTIWAVYITIYCSIILQYSISAIFCIARQL